MNPLSVLEFRYHWMGSLPIGYPGAGSRFPPRYYNEE